VQCVFFGRLWVGLALKRACILWSGGSKKNQLFKADVQNDAHSPTRMHAVVISNDQRPCRRCSAECCRDAITVTWKTRHFRHFSSEQNKVSKSKVVEKVKHVADFCMSADDIYVKSYKNWWMYVKAEASQTWDVFFETQCNTKKHPCCIKIGQKSRIYRHQTRQTYRQKDTR